MSKKIKIYNPITDKESKIDPYGRTAKKIYRYMFDAGASPEDILPANLTYNNNRFIRVKPIEDVSNVRRITYAKVIASIGKSGDTFSYFRDIMKSYQGQTIKLVKRYTNFDIIVGDFDAIENMEKLIKEGKKKKIDFLDNISQVQVDEIVTIPSGAGFSKWWNANSVFFMIDSDKEVFGAWNEDLKDDPKLQAQLLILTLDKVKKEQVNQYFLDGVTHCFFHPIQEWALECEDSSKSKSAQKRYKTINNKLDKYIEKYHEGIPEEDMAEVCNDLQISVEIDLPSTMMDKKTKFIEIESQKKPLKKFRFVNTRLNHIELNKVNSKDNYEEVTKDEIMNIFVDCKKRKEFILWKESKDGVTQVNTLNQIYKLKDEGGYQDAVNQFEEDNNISDYKIERNQNKDLTEFLESSLNCNQSITFTPKCDYIDAASYILDYCDNPQSLEENKKDLENPSVYDLNQPGYHEQKKLFDWMDGLKNLNHIDIRKAYTQGSNCVAYQGYLGKITDFRKTDKIVGLGIYQIKNINFSGCAAIEKMKCLHEFQSYPSPELEFYQKLGIQFDITMGCWGQSFDFEFPKYMLTKENGLPHYSKWYGCLMKDTSIERYNFNCKDIKYAELNAYQTDSTIRYNREETAGVIEYPRKHSYHQFHLASFIASYSRITVLEQILKFKDFNQIVSVVVDGIYYRGEVEVGPLFSDKEQKSLKHSMYSDSYLPDYGLTEFNMGGDYRENNKYEIHLGAGGAGKTHNNLIDKGLVNPLFIAPSWKLARNKKSEYGIHSTTFYHVLCDDPDIWRPLGRNYSNFVVDEISMLSEEQKQKMIKRYPNHKIIFCGDVGYQLPPIQGSQFNIDCGIPVIHHTKNYRCECDVLAKHLLHMRKLIEVGFDSTNCESIIKKIGFDIHDPDSIDYTVDDLIICYTHKTKNKYTEKYKHLHKYSVLENTRDYSNGDIIIGPKPEKVRCEMRHAYTVHSVQGETAKNKLFIDINKFTSVKMLYTAMSRCRRVDQIVFIK